MPDYKEMYFKMFKASERAINLLIVAQQECEEHYISSPEPEFQVISLPTENKKGVDEESFQINALIRKKMTYFD